MLFLTEGDVRDLLTMDDAIAIVEQVFRELSENPALNIPRRRAKTDGVMLHLLGGSAAGIVGYKAYSTSKSGAHFQVGLFDGVTGEPLTLMQADYLGQVRTGAASGVATRYLARTDAVRLGLFGTGKQARTQAWAISRVRKLERIRVFSRNEANRRLFARDMESICGCVIEPVADPRDAVEGMDVVVTATSAKTPIFEGQWLSPGTHLNVIGSNYLNKTEIDVETVRRCDLVTIDDVEQGRAEAGDFVAAMAAGVLSWDRVHGLGEVVAGRVSGRSSSADITLFKSLGLGVEDVAVAASVYRAALALDRGARLPLTTS